MLMDGLAQMAFLSITLGERCIVVLMKCLTVGDLWAVVMDCCM